MRTAGGERGVGVAAVLLGLAVIGESLRLPEETLTGGPGTRFLPLLLGLTIAGLGAGIAGRGRLARPAVAPRGRAGPARPGGAGLPGPGPDDRFPPAAAAAGPPAASGARGPAPRRSVGLTLAAVGAYAVAFEPLGFLAASGLFLTGLLLAYGERRWPVVAGVALAATALTYAVFGLWLRVPLPPGVLGR